MIGLAALAIAVDLAVRRRSPAAAMDGADEVAVDDAEMTVLGLHAAESRAVLGGWAHPVRADGRRDGGTCDGRFAADD